MTIKIRELTINANIVEENSIRGNNHSLSSHMQENKQLYSSTPDFYSNEFKRRRER
ncbi:MAG: hypothetical protein J6Y78_00055 [Paludibacteraceae bacterium]|nr:hypothetical protein [Paludibacteraceae bacterium]